MKKLVTLLLSLALVLEVLFRAYDADDFMGEDFANEVITLNP